jgi:acetyl esterase/lipase
MGMFSCPWRSSTCTLRASVAVSYKSFMRTSVISLTAVFAFWAGCVTGSARAAAPPGDVLFEKDVVYGTVDGTDLKLDLARPKDEAKFPGPRACVLIIHGGGWAAGNRSGLDSVAWTFAQKGYVSASVGYRLAPAHPFPAPVQDVKCAVRFLRAHAAQYHIDPKRFGAAGLSAGGHLAMMLGTMDDSDGLNDSGGWPGESGKVQAVVSFFGPTDLTAELPAVSKPILEKFIGATKEKDPEVYRKASPVTYVKADSAPMLLFQGTNDPLVPYTQAVRMIAAMQKAGVPGRAELISLAGHGWFGPELDRTAAAMFAFFDEHLNGSKTVERHDNAKDTKKKD